MISVSEAIKIVKKKVSPLGAETVDLNEVCGRILAEDIFADMDLPPFDRSQMDGFAVRAEDVEKATAENPVWLKIIGESSAGKGFDGVLSAGEAVRIMTGARVPQGANAVQRVEDTCESPISEVKSPEVGNDEIFESEKLTNDKRRTTDKKQAAIGILKSVKAGKNINYRASEIAEKTRVLEIGEKITAESVACLASFGYAKVQVGKRPRVTISATGNEIVPPSQKPQKDQIRDSNSITLKSYAEECGASVKVLPNVGDDFDELKEVIQKAAENSDILILSGGVSVGDYDFTKPALRELGAEIFFEKIALRPGKPTVFAKLGECFVFGLPGNPVSIAVTFNLFARPAILKMQAALNTELKTGFAVLGDKIKAAKGRDSYLPATLSTDKKGSLIAAPLKWSGSSNFVAFARAEALVLVPADRDLEKEEAAEILFL